VEVFSRAITGGLVSGIEETHRQWRQTTRRQSFYRLDVKIAAGNI
jgi:hypothetical protein